MLKRDYLVFRRFFGLGLFIVCLTLPNSAMASGHQNLEEGIPPQVEDAYPIAYLGREIQGVFRYDNTRDGKNLAIIQPQVEYGFARNWQGTLTALYRLGNSDETRGSGNTEAGVLYNLGNLLTRRLWTRPPLPLQQGPSSRQEKVMQG